MGYTVYKHTSPDGKVYIGTTSQRVKKRWQNGLGYTDSPRFWRAIQEIGWDNFSHEILYTNLSQEDAYELEISLISKYKSNDPQYGYNVSSGGESGFSGVKMSDAMKERLRSFNFGRRISDETREKLSKARKGKKFSEEHKKAISDALKGKHRVGHPHTEESKEKLRIAMIGKKHPHEGVPRSEECRKKLSIAHRGKPSPNRIRIKCVETGEEFESIRAGANSKGIDERNVAACVRGERKTAGGYHWVFCDKRSTGRLIMEILEGKT